MYRTLGFPLLLMKPKQALACLFCAAGIWMSISISIAQPLQELTRGGSDPFLQQQGIQQQPSVEKPTKAVEVDDNERQRERKKLESTVTADIEEGRIVNAIAGLEKLLGLERELFGKEHDEVLGSLSLLTDLHLLQTDFAAAKRAASEVVVIKTHRFGQSDWRTTDARVIMEEIGLLELMSLEARQRLTEVSTTFDEASKLRESGDLADAIEKAQSAIDGYRELLGPEHPNYATSLKLLAMLLESQGESDRAVALFGEAIEIRKRSLGEEHPDYATILNDLGNTYYNKKEYSLAEPLYRRALEIAKRTRGESHSDCITYLDNLALLLSDQGNYFKSVTLHGDYLELLQKTDRLRSVQYCNQLNELALAHCNMGSFALAEPLFRQAIKLIQEIQTKESSEYGAYVHNLARLYSSVGDLRQAETYYLDALRIVKDVHGERSPTYARCANNLAITYFRHGKWDQAESLCSASVAIRKEVLGEHHPDYAASLNVLAAIYDALGKHEEARALLLQMLEIAKEGLGRNHPQYTDYVNNLAIHLLSCGDSPGAKSLLLESNELYKRQLGERHPTYAVGLNNLSLALMSSGNLEEALPCSMQAAEIQRTGVDSIAAIQSDRQQFLTATLYREALDTLVTLLVDRDRATIDEYNEVFQAKGRVWRRQSLTRATALAAADHPDLATLVADMRSIATRYAKLGLETPDPSRRESWKSELADLRDLLESRERDLSKQCAQYQLAQQPIGPRDLQKELPPDAVLIDMFEYAHYEFDANTHPSLTQQRKLAAFVIRHDTPLIKVVPLGRVKDVSEWIEVWRQSYGLSSQAKSAGEKLRQQLWEPLQPYVNGMKLVVVSPDGALGRFPLPALPGQAPGTYLLEECCIAIVPCAMALPGMLAKTGEKLPPTATGNLMILANVDYDSLEKSPPQDLPASFGRNHVALRGADWKAFRSLPATEGELASIAKLYRDRFGNDGITILEGANADEEGFCREAIRHKYLHIATHGFFAPEGLRSNLNDIEPLLKTSTFATLGSDARNGYAPPGLLSGLVLAGANRTATQGELDGIVTSAEVENLDLRNVQLVVLSACETGLGEQAGGEGLLGLQRAFQVAGAQTVVASLWQVGDQSTRALMERFYFNLFRKGMSTIESLREAQLWMLRESASRGLVRNDVPSTTSTSPLNWAAFVLSGDWR